MFFHTRQTADSQPVWLGSRNLVPDTTHDNPHDYAYGTSRESLRPTGPFPDETAPVKTAKPAKRRKPVVRTTEWERRIRPVRYRLAQPVVYAAKVEHEAERTHHGVTQTSMTVETMLADLLDEEQSPFPETKLD